MQSALVSTTRATIALEHLLRNLRLLTPSRRVVPALETQRWRWHRASNLSHSDTPNLAPSAAFSGPVTERTLIGLVNQGKSDNANSIHTITALLAQLDTDDQQLTVLLYMFFKYTNVYPLLEEHNAGRINSALFHRFVSQLDHFLVQNDQLTDFQRRHRLLSGKHAGKPQDHIKRFLYRMYKSVTTALPPHQSLTPNFAELFPLTTLDYLLHSRFKPTKKPVGDEAFLELIEALLARSPHLRSVLLQRVHRFKDMYHDYSSVAVIGRLERWLYDPRGSILLVDTDDRQHKPDPNWRRLTLTAELLDHHLDAQCYRGPSLSPSDTLSVQFVDTEAEFTELLHSLLTEPDCSLDTTVIGLDTEWFPLFDFQPVRMSVLQIATDRRCAIVDLSRFAEKPAEYRRCWHRFVAEVLHNPTVAKVGFAMSQEIDLLRASTDTPHLELCNLLDLAECSVPLIEFIAGSEPPLAHSTVSDPWLSAILTRARQSLPPTNGLSQLIYVLFGQRLDKSEGMSNWDQRPLRTGQMIYASLDALCLVHIHRTLAQLQQRLCPRFASLPEWIQHTTELSVVAKKEQQQQQLQATESKRSRDDPR